MPMPLLVPVAVASAILTLKSDTRPATVYVKKPRGTLYWGGAGLDGPYIQPQLAAFQRAGIEHVRVGLTNTAVASFGAVTGPVLDAIRAGTLIRYKDDAEWTIASGMTDDAPQFNLIGYSYGSVLAAQTAHWYARQQHVVDHLVLIGSPIDGDFLADLRSMPTIKRVIVKDLRQFGDPIYAGLSQHELILAAPELKRQQDRRLGEGHFYYAHVVRDSVLRWKSLASELVDQGVR